MKDLSFEKMESLNGGVTRVQYCRTLGDMINGGGYQGDIDWFWDNYWDQCGRYGIGVPGDR